MEPARAREHNPSASLLPLVPAALAVDDEGAAAGEGEGGAGEDDLAAALKGGKKKSKKKAAADVVGVHSFVPCVCFCIASRQPFPRAQRAAGAAPYMRAPAGSTAGFG